MCPNINNPRERVCPPGGPAHKPKTLCRFVCVFLDNHNRKVFISHGIGINKKKWGSVRQNHKRTWQIKLTPFRRSFDEVQEKLNAYAINEGWSVYE
jgi:hypothetical protein